MSVLVGWRERPRTEEDPNPAPIPVILGDPLIIASTKPDPGETPEQTYIKICDIEKGYRSDFAGLFNYLRSRRAAAHLAFATMTTGGIEAGLSLGSLLKDEISWRQPAAFVLGATAAYLGGKRLETVVVPFTDMSESLNPHPRPEPARNSFPPNLGTEHLPIQT